MSRTTKRDEVVAWISDEAGQMVAVSQRARRELGIQAGQACKDALPTAVRSPCSDACAQRLRRAGCAEGTTTQLGMNGRIFTLTCVPTQTGVVSTLSGGEPDGAPWQALTAREVDMLYGLADGLTTAQIAREYGVSSATVRTHIEHIRVKFDVPTRAALVAQGYRRGYLS